MGTNRLLLVFLALSFSIGSYGQVKRLVFNDVVLLRDFSQYFKRCKVEGSIAILDLKAQKWILSDTTSNMKETLPASTFKILNLLIALETRVIKDADEVVIWPGYTDTLSYGYRPDIYRSMTVKEAFQLSAGWVFVELAKRVGRANYQKYLTQCNYGNKDLSQRGVDFWNFGNLGISPINQVEFIRKLYEEKLPFSKRTMEIAKRVMITEKTNEYNIRAKTGWVRDRGINIGWWVGYIEIKQNVFFFATRLTQDRSLDSSSFGTCRMDITKAVLRESNILNR